LTARNVFVFISLFTAALCIPAACFADEMVRPDKSKIRLVVEPGQAASGVILVENPGSEPKTVRAYLEDWAYVEPFDGTKDFRPAGSSASSASSWITFNPSELALSSGGRGKINYVVKVPEKAEGSRQCAMFLESMATAPGAEGVGVNLAVRVAVLFYVEVQGTTKREIALNELSVKRSSKGMLEIALPIKNTGTVDLMTGGTFNIMGANGMIAGRGEFNNVYMLPGDSGVLKASWSLPIEPGDYSLVLTLDLGKALEELNMGRGPVIVKEASLKIGSGGEIESAGALK
jgi:hypothetical protein